MLSLIKVCDSGKAFSIFSCSSDLQLIALLCAMQLWLSDVGCCCGCIRVAVEDEDVVEVARSLVDTRVYRDIVDFDNHLDDISLDWRNVDIDLQIAECVC